MTKPANAVAYESLRKERDRFVAFAFAAADMLFEIDRSGRIVFADGATSGLLGKSPPQLIGSRFDDLLDRQSQPAYLAMIESLRGIQRIDGTALVMQSEASGISLAVQLSAFHFNREDGHLYFSISAERDALLDAELKRRDMYSGFLDKDAFIEQANSHIQNAHLQGETLHLTLLDFPSLKRMLSSLSSAQARKLMQSIGDYLREHSVDGDTAGDFGDGMSYGVLHEQNQSVNEIVAVIGDLIRTNDPEHRKVESRVATLVADSESLTAQDSARALLYTINSFAQEKGDDFSIASLSGSYQVMLKETVDKISRFKDIVSSAEFDLAFQPIVEIESGMIHHFECLVRLKPGKQDFHNPFHFISFGESAGLINDFDLLMLQRTIDLLVDLSARGIEPRVSVNVSGKSLSSTLFMDSFLGIVEKRPMLRKLLIVEITESSKIADIKLANEFVQKLRTQGIRVCLDDFGTGESSFEYLRYLHVDFIKIDGSYVKESLQTKHGRNLLQAMAGLCRALGIVTIGEMVEDQTAAEQLRDAGVKYGQGYLFGKPDQDIEQLADCDRQTPHFKGFPKRKRIRRFEPGKEWWERREA